MTKFNLGATLICAVMISDGGLQVFAGECIYAYGHRQRRRAAIGR